MKRWKWSHSIQRKTILGMVLVGLLPLLLSLFLTYVEERRALRETSGSNFKGIAVEVARKIETQITRGINEAQQLATIPFIRSAVTGANRSYEGREPEKIKAFIVAGRCCPQSGCGRSAGDNARTLMISRCL